MKLSKKITILSGKGGVGKSSLTASLAVLLGKNKKIVAADCDVDAPNLGLCLGLKDKDYSSWKKIETIEKAKIDYKKCISCKKCFESCYFDAIRWVNNKPIIDKMKCEGCGVCQLVCPSNAISMIKVKNAKIGVGRTKYGFRIISGQLKIGESGSGKVVTVVRQKAEAIGKKENAEIILVDSAAGIGCPVIASVAGSDFVIAVTEPTPSALSDLKRALEVVFHFGIKCGIVINKWDLNKNFSRKIEGFARKGDIPVLGKLPYDRAFVDALVNLKPIVVFDKKYEKIFLDLISKIKY